MPAIFLCGKCTPPQQLGSAPKPKPGVRHAAAQRFSMLGLMPARALAFALFDVPTAMCHVSDLDQVSTPLCQPDVFIELGLRQNQVNMDVLTPE
jgi:hypothetical protein